LSSVTEIRRLTADDWHIFRRVRLMALKEAPYAYGSRWQDEVDRGEDDWKAAVVRRTRFVAEAGGQVVGMVAVGPSTHSGAADVTSMWVDPGSRGQGVGASLLSTVLDWARNAGRKQVLLWVTEDNPHAERLYERHGFRRTGDVHRVREGETRLEYEMSLRF
jgi:ribosomal protein S18 acetylase RimI-like enzyme